MVVVVVRSFQPVKIKYFPSKRISDPLQRTRCRYCCISLERCLGTTLKQVSLLVGDRKIVAEHLKGCG